MSYVAKERHHDQPSQEHHDHDHDPRRPAASSTLSSPPRRLRTLPPSLPPVAAPPGPRWGSRASSVRRLASRRPRVVTGGVAQFVAPAVIVAAPNPLRP